MPQRIRTPEDIFRAERRDVFALHFLQEDPQAVEACRQEMAAWFARHMPDSPTELLAPSEHSGFIVGGPIGLRIAFTDADFQRFCAEWETPKGKSLDPRFQCYQYPWQKWWERHGQFQPTLARAEAPGVSVWIDSPLGRLVHVLPEGGEHVHPAKAQDLWANACQRWPELQGHDLDDLRFGRVLWSPPTNRWVLLWVEPFRTHTDTPEAHWQAVADWLRLPVNTEIGSEY